MNISIKSSDREETNLKPAINRKDGKIIDIEISAKYSNSRRRTTYCICQRYH